MFPKINQRGRGLLFVLALVVSFSACRSSSFGHRDPNCNVDERLARLMRDYQYCKQGRSVGDEGNHVLIDCDRVANEIERLSVEFPRHVPTLLANAGVSYEQRQPEKATRYLDLIFSIDGRYPDAAVLRSRISIEAGNLPAARRMLEDQIRRTPDHAGLREAYSGLLYTVGDLEGAKTALIAAEGLGAPAWRVAFNRGLIAEGEGDVAAAEQHYAAAVNANVDFQPAQSRLAGIRAERGYNAKPSTPPGKAGAK